MFDRLLVIAVAEVQVALYEVPIDCWVQLGILGDIVNCFLCVSIQEEGLASFEICFRKVVVEVDANCQIVLALLVVLERPLTYPTVEEVLGYILFRFGDRPTDIFQPFIYLPKVVVNKTSKEQLVGVGVVQIIGPIKLL